MKEVIIQIPTYESEQNIEIDVKINGRKRTLKYKVEIIDWEDVRSTDDEDRVEVIKRVINEHDRDWRLIQIGVPTDKTIPIMWQKKPG
jgi:alpha-L-arabinofuranosidase